VHPLVLFVFSFLEQEAASSQSSAFSGCSGLAQILDNLSAVPTVKPCAKKRKLLKSKKVSVPKVSVPKPVPVHKPAVPKSVSVPELNMSRKCVHSRAYKAAAREAKEGGLSKAEISKAACKAGKEATDKWDDDHA